MEHENNVSWNSFVVYVLLNIRSHVHETNCNRYLASFYWNMLKKHEKKKLLRFICLEFILQGMSWIYKRQESNLNHLVKLNDNEIGTVVLKRLKNLCYNTSNSSSSQPYLHTFSPFSEGKLVTVESCANQLFNGSYQFDSVINNNWVYIKFDSRSHFMILL